MKPVFCLMGPTASGKTNLAIHLVQQFPFEIVSVDSALVYRGMNIGTAKPDKKTLLLAPHHLLDIRDPAEAYSAAQFCGDALRLIDEIHARNNIPLLVGGTMLYFRALQQGLAAMPAANPKIREQLMLEAAEQGWGILHQRLQSIDPEAAKRIHPHDPQRIQRALEVYMLSGKNISAWQQEQENIAENNAMHNIIIAPADRNILHQRIAQRFQQMLVEGFVDEVKQLRIQKDLTLDTPAIRSVGYRQVWEYLDGLYSYEEMQQKAIVATRQLAKRQLTWLRSWPNAVWFNSEAPDIERQLVDFIGLLYNSDSQL